MQLFFSQLESIIIQDPNITAAIIFGHGRFQNGVLIQPAVAFDSTNENLLSNFRNKIWYSIAIHVSSTSKLICFIGQL